MTDHPDPHPTSDDVAGLSRRGVLALSAGGAAAVLLGGCAGSGPETVEPGASATDSVAPPEELEASPTQAGPLAATADVPVGGGVILEDAKIVVTQPTAGEFKAFDGICTHQSCLVSSVKGKRISCGCHGSSFGIADGKVLSGPATRPLDEIKVKVEGDKIVKA